MLPGGVDAVVKVVRRCGAAAPAAAAGQSAEIGLSLAGGADAAALGAALRRGAVVCAGAAPAPAAVRVECRVQTLELALPLLKGASATLHVAVGAAPCVVSRLVALHDPSTNEVTRARPRAVASRCAATIEVELVEGERIVCEEYARCRSLGRLCLRDGGRTLAVGIVTKVLD